MTLDEILNMDHSELNSLTKAELKPIVQQMGSAVRARQQSMKKAQQRGEIVYSPAVEGLKKIGPISTRGANIDTLRAEYKRARQFLTGKTGNIAGAREYRANMLDWLGLDASATSAEIAAAWDAVHKLQNDFSAELMQQTGELFYKKLVRTVTKLQREGSDATQIKEAADELYKTFQKNAQTPNLEYENFPYEPD